ncbi:S-sulfocysteine synthase [Actinomadura sp. RB99]|nr:S-sulfocysteine synthase [Actinomadura sp. RB99]
MVARAQERGELVPGMPIIESTSGTLGLGLVLAGISYGHPATLVTDPGMEPLMVNLLRAHGARVEVVTEPHPVGGWQEAAATCPGAARPPRRRLLPGPVPQPDNGAAYEGLASELAD